MKKIKILKILILILLTYIVVKFFMTILSIPSEHIFRISISFIPSFLLFTGLVFLVSGLRYSLKKGYFNYPCTKKFKITGYLFISSGTLGLILYIMTYFSTSGQDTIIVLKTIMYQKIALNAFVIIVGIGILILSDIIKKGNSIQQENDLTI